MLFVVTVKYISVLCLETILGILVCIMVRRLLESVSDIESYSLEHNIWWSRVVPLIIVAVLFIIVLIYLIQNSAVRMSL